MLKYKVQINGLTPMLQDNARIMNMKEPKNDAERKLKLELQTYKYVEDKDGIPYPHGGPNDGHLYMPTIAVERSILSASKIVKMGKKKFFDIINGWIEIEPEFYMLLSRDGKPIDEYTTSPVRTTINRANKARIPKNNPQIELPWQINFILRFDDEYVGINDDAFETNMMDVIKMAGRKMGLGAWAPRSQGKFGKFECSVFEKI